MLFDLFHHGVRVSLAYPWKANQRFAEEAAVGVHVAHTAP